MFRPQLGDCAVFYTFILLKLDFWGAMTFVSLVMGKKINVFSAFRQACVQARKEVKYWAF